MQYRSFTPMHSYPRTLKIPYALFAPCYVLAHIDPYLKHERASGFLLFRHSEHIGSLPCEMTRTTVPKNDIVSSTYSCSEITGHTKEQ